MLSDKLALFLFWGKYQKMCLILFAVNPNERFRLVVAANRDEFYARPSTPAGFWDDKPDLLAGKDEQMGGTWLGVTRKGHFAAVTNFREELIDPVPPRSRGELPLTFLTGNSSPQAFVTKIAKSGHEYRGFNLLVSEGHDLRKRGPDRAPTGGALGRLFGPRHGRHGAEHRRRDGGMAGQWR